MFKKLFHRKSSTSRGDVDQATDNSKPLDPSLPAEKAMNEDSNSDKHPVQAGQPMQAGQPGPGAQVYVPPQPHNDTRPLAQNLGMAGGAAMAMESGGNVGMGMVDGMVVGGWINQTVQSHRKHQYWGEQALNYQAGMPAAGVGDPRVVTPMGERERARAEGGRDERRRKRWERRAKRRGDVVPGSE